METPESPPACAIVIPVFNEAGRVGPVLRSICATLKNSGQGRARVYCIDDGSTDGSADEIAAEGVTLLRNPVNLGYGASLQACISHTTEPLILIIDGDGTYPVEDISTLLDAMVPGVDMVVGQRVGEGLMQHPLRRTARWILREMVRALTNVRVSDLNSGMRVFRRELYDEFRHLLPKGFSFTTTITVASLFNGRNVRYIPIAYARREGSSHIRPLRDFVGFVVLILRIATYFSGRPASRRSRTPER